MAALRSLLYSTAPSRKHLFTCGHLAILKFKASVFMELTVFKIVKSLQEHNPLGDKMRQEANPESRRK